MKKGGRPGLAELKVGLFVLITCTILGAAIFTIGTQVGLLEETFFARTYLNNVSGLKPGDIVLLAGVETGNVVDVRITPPEELPATATNQQIRGEIEILTRRAESLQGQLSPLRTQLGQARDEYNQAVEQLGLEAQGTRDAAERRDDLRSRVEQLEEELAGIDQTITSARANLQNIVVMTEIRSEYRDWIRSDSRISLGSIGLLGDKYIEISLGRSTDPPAVVKEPVDSWFGGAEREVVIITGTSQPGFQELITGADDVLANLSVLSDKLNDIMSPLSQGQGSAGAFLRDTSFYDNLNRVVVNANRSVERVTQLVSEVKEGQGTLARLIQEGEVYDKINEATGDLRDILERVDQAEGTLGKFVNDPAFYEQGLEMIGNVQRITRKMDQGEGTLGRLSSDERLYEDLRQSLSRFNTFVANIEDGKGTLGRLANDEELYRNLSSASSEIIKMLYDFRQNPKKFLTIKLELF